MYNRYITLAICTYGTYFVLDINECISYPCTNDGTCIDEVNGYSCTCLGGFTGTQCEISN